MGGDYERFTFNANNDYAGVFKQQGRVSLPTDWNELVQIFDRRWRAETIDLAGHCLVPASTPDAFLITPTAIADVEIGIGRMYVDGLLAECHGRDPQIYTPDLGELQGTTAIPYSDQPYYPAPLPPPLSGATGTTDLVYLEAWQREVTAIEAPDIREVALGGADTTTRLQTAWQVRVLPDIGDHQCSDSIPAWDALIAPPAGRLTVTANPPPASDDPCIIAPSGGYRGLENRLYRVEIHRAGALGTARFKWSRDNGSVVSVVEAITASRDQVTVKSLGRDQVLRFHIGDWVEILDDHREFQGNAGHLARITGIDEANRILTLDPAIPATVDLDATDSDRHTRLRRWDQRSGVDAQGLLPVNGGSIALEDGIEIAFSLDPASGSFRVGDYWVFAARTATGTVEALQEAPPFGVLRHYCRLALIHWGDSLDTTEVEDCRTRPQPLDCGGCCTVTVGDGVDSQGQFTDIQEAIDALGGRGGVVCLGRGVFVVRTTILIGSERNIIIRGMGAATRILFMPESDTPTDWMILRSCDHIRIEDLFVAALNARSLIHLVNCQFCTVQRCTLVNLNPGGQAQVSGRALEFSSTCDECRIEHNALLAAKGIVAAGSVRQLLVRDNQSIAVQLAVFVQQAEGLEIVHNQFRGITREMIAELGEVQTLSRATIDEFQMQVTQAFRSALAFNVNQFQAIGIFIVSGNRVVIADNLITAQVSVLAFLLLNAQLTNNQILALIGFLLVFGILIRIANSVVLALLVGCLQIGIVANLIAEGNIWLGFYGMVFQSLGQAFTALATLMGAAVNQGGLTNGSTTITNRFTAEQATVGQLNAFGLATTVKIHRNSFFTFFTGVYKTDVVLTGDWSIIDNSFTLCSRAGIELGQQSGGVFQEQGRFLIPRHLIQSNGFQVSGSGIISGSSHTWICDNSITCPAVAIDIDSGSSAIRNNILRGIATNSQLNVGLIVVHDGASNLCITDNRLEGAPGHGILIQESVFNLTVEQNSIQFTDQTPISTANSIIQVDRLRIASNTIQSCTVGSATGAPWMPGAIVISGGRDIQILDNTITNNSPSGQAAAFYVLYGEDMQNLQIMNNRLTDNARFSSLSPANIAGIRLQSVTGDIQIIGNTIRSDRGRALLITEWTGNQLQRLLIQNNSWSRDNPQPGINWVNVSTIEYLHMEGNQILQGTMQTPISPLVYLVAARAIINGNTIQSSGTLPSLQVVAATGSTARGIVTSNLTTGSILSSGYSPGTLAIAHNLLLP